MNRIHHFWGTVAVDAATGAGTSVHARFANANGARVDANTEIGVMGSTGYTDPCPTYHLHERRDQLHHRGRGACSPDFTGDGKADIAWYEPWNQNGITVLSSTNRLGPSADFLRGKETTSRRTTYA